MEKTMDNAFRHTRENCENKKENHLTVERNNPQKELEIDHKRKRLQTMFKERLRTT